MYLTYAQHVGKESEQVGMRAGLQKQQCQFVVILLPRHQPVRLDVAFPCLLPLVDKLVRMVCHRQSACLLKQKNGIMDESHIQSTFLTAQQIFFETLRSYDFVLHTLMPNSLNKSSTES